MKAGAYNAYKGVAVTSLIVCAQNERIELPAEQTYFNVLKAMLEHYLNHLSPEEIVEILDKAMAADATKDPILSELLQSPEIRDTFGEDEVKILDTWKAFRALGWLIAD